MKLRRGSVQDIQKQIELEQNQREATEEKEELLDEDVIGNIDLETEELSVFLSLDNYSSYVFDVLLPFLTDLLGIDFESVPKE